MKVITVKKGEIVQRKGEFNSKVYVVKSGLLRSYIIDDKGKEHIFMFAPEGWTIADNQPADVPTTLIIDALEDSTIVVLPKNLEREEKHVPQLVKRLAVLQQRIIMLMSNVAIERYEHFAKTYPDILQRVPQRMIASYLGITPESLSATKNAWLKKKL